MACTNCLYPISTASNKCTDCGKLFCAECPLKRGKFPIQGTLKLVPLCSECYNKISTNEVEGWRKKRMQLLHSESSEDIQAGVSCFLMELYASNSSGYTAVNLANKCAKQLIEESLPHLALPLLLATASQCETPGEKIRGHILMSKALELIAYDASTPSKDQILLLKAAKAECDAASSVKAHGTEIPDLSTRIASLEKTVAIIEAEDERQLKRAIQLAYSKLTNAWIGGDWDNIFQIISDTASDHLKRSDGANPTMLAMKEFVKVNSENKNKMMIQFLDGVVCIFEDKFCEGLKNIEEAVWDRGEYVSSKFYSTAVDLVIGVLLHHPENVMPFRNLQSSFEKCVKGVTLNPSIVLASLHLTEEELLPPFKSHWPNIPLLTKIKSYEDFANQKITKGEWTGTNAAENYLDMIEKCQHPAETAICFLNASLWLLKMLKEKSTESPALSDVYALKMAIFHYLSQSFIIGASCLKIGMQFYIARIAVAATLLASKFAAHQSTPKDAKQVVQFLYMFLHAARFCPFWKAPLVLACEATVLNDMLNRQHCTFISKLKHIPKEFCHLEQYEVLYRLYENDLTGLHKQKNPTDLKHQTMQELLQRRGLTSDNVSFLMKTSLCKRTPEGWICNQQPVGTNLEFSEIKGLRVHFNTFSPLNPVTLELLVIRSNGSNGLISSSDMDTFLTIEPGELMPLYFSLDPPSRDEKYHPFQELRFHPKALQNTEVLETLLDADYLMKFFSVGSEVSANPPFDQRPSVDGLLAKLPPHLREALKSVPEYGNAKSSLYRFWIEAKEMQYDIEQSGNVITVKCGSPEMIIRKHRMYYDPDGEMHDTEDDDDPDSPESKFAAAMTENYDEIGKYFVAYARLKELCKLQLLTVFIKKNLIELNNDTKLEITDIETNAKINVSTKTATKPILPCWWVPASLSKNERMMCYGGVNLAPNYVKCTMPVLPPNVTAVQLQGASRNQRYTSTLGAASNTQKRPASSQTSSTSAWNSSTSSRHSPSSLTSSRNLSSDTSSARPKRQQIPTNQMVGGTQHGQQLPQRTRASAPTCQPPVVVISSAGCKELPIAKALLSSPVNPATYKAQFFSKYPHAVKKLLEAMFPASSKHCHNATRSATNTESRDGNRARSSINSSGGSGDGGGGGSGGGGSGGGSGEGDDGGRGLSGIVFSGVIGTLVMAKLLSSELRHAYAQRKFRKQQGCKDPNVHTAHILSFEVVVYAVQDGILKGSITMSREKIVKCLKTAMNIKENFQLVERSVNLRDHRRHDRALINKDKAFLCESLDRSTHIRNFFVNHFVSRVPFEITKALLNLFEECGMISSKTAQEIEKDAETKAPKVSDY